MFEDNFDEFYMQNGEGELTVPKGWTAVWEPGDKPGPIRPEYKPDDVRVYEGKFSAKLAHTFAFFRAAIYRKIQIPNNTVFSFTAQALYVSNKGGMGQVIGVDLAGGIDFPSNTIQWGEWQGVNEGWDGSDWRELTFSGRSLSNYVTLFLRADCRFAIQTNAAFFDHVVVNWEGGSTPGSDVGTLMRIMADNYERFAADLRNAL